MAQVLVKWMQRAHSFETAKQKRWNYIPVIEHKQFKGLNILIVRARGRRGGGRPCRSTKISTNFARGLSACFTNEGILVGTTTWACIFIRFILTSRSGTPWGLFTRRSFYPRVLAFSLFLKHIAKWQGFHCFPIFLVKFSSFDVY